MRCTYMRNVANWVRYLKAEVAAFPDQELHDRVISISQTKETTYADAPQLILNPTNIEPK